MVIMNQGINIRLNVGQLQSQIASFFQVQAIPLLTEDCVCMTEASFDHVRAGKFQKKWLSCCYTIWVLNTCVLVVPEVTQTSILIF